MGTGSQRKQKKGEYYGTIIVRASCQTQALHAQSDVSMR